MLPSAHYSSGVIIFSIMSILGLIPKNLLYLSLMIVLSLIPDLDFFMSRRHREVITHSVIFWAIIVSATVVARPEYWIAAPPIFCHLFLDSFDWGVTVFFPFSRRKFGLKILKEQESDKKYGFLESVDIYLLNRKLLYLEGVLLIMSIVLLVGAAYCS